MKTFRRVIRIVTRGEASGAGEARAVVEDDYHHFRVSILHDGKHVTGSLTDSHRWPFTLCRAAGDRLQELVGMPLSTDVTAVFRRADARQQCTHQFDIAALAVTAAARGIALRRYDIAIPERIDGHTYAELSRDGREILRWEVFEQKIVAPGSFAGRGIGSGFTDWAITTFSVEEAEAALILRRGVFLSLGRNPDWPVRPHALPTGACWVQQPERNEQALEMVGSRRDFSKQPHLLVAGDEEWIRFSESPER